MIRRASLASFLILGLVCGARGRPNLLEDPESNTRTLASVIHPRLRFSRQAIEPRSPTKKVDFLLDEARHHLEPEELANIDLTNEKERKDLQALIADKQAKAAQYVYQVEVQDEISDSYMSRTEERNGLVTKGSYSYSDGYFEHNVAYVADANGYRVTKMDSRPIGDGPQEDKFGRAIVQSYIGGVSTQYAIKAEPLSQDDTKSEFREHIFDQSSPTADVRLGNFPSEQVLEATGPTDGQTPQNTRTINVDTSKPVVVAVGEKKSIEESVQKKDQ
eukprot:maker-scaffold380_size190731-snap-gene-0.47 protein:Tk02443 transcript:maker-scaffold380_size190731-snap-gene-0.47-mRNA-1 annotation:"conserved hypothetical protein"